MLDEFYKFTCSICGKEYIVNKRVFTGLPREWIEIRYRSNFEGPKFVRGRCITVLHDVSHLCSTECLEDYTDLVK